MDLKNLKHLPPVSDIHFDLYPESDIHFDLHTAVSIGSEEQVIEIIENSENKAIVNQKTSHGWTPLMYAVAFSNLRIAGLLLEEGACTNIKNTSGLSALIIASKSGSTDAVGLLIHNGADVNDKDYKGRSALSYATSYRHRSVVQLLIEKGAAPDQTDIKAGVSVATLTPSEQDNGLLKVSLNLNLSPPLSTKSGGKCKNTALKSPVKSILPEKNYSSAKFSPLIQSNQSNLAKLLAELKLSKYLHIFESHGIDYNSFWLLSEDDLKEMGILLLGPRKRISTVITEWYRSNLSKGHSDDSIFCCKLISEHQKLQQRMEELESSLRQETDLRKAAEDRLSQGIKTLSNFSDTVQRTMTFAVTLEEKLKQNHANLKAFLCSTTERNFNKFRQDIALPLISGAEKTLDELYRYTCLALQQTNFRT